MYVCMDQCWEITIHCMPILFCFVLFHMMMMMMMFFFDNFELLDTVELLYSISTTCFYFYFYCG